MKTEIVDREKVFASPGMSLNPQMYTGDEELIMFYLKRFTPNDQKTLEWMIEEGIVTPEQMGEYVKKAAQKIMESPVRRVRNLKGNLSTLLGGE